MVTGFSLRFYADNGCLPGALLEEYIFLGNCIMSELEGGPFRRGYEAEVSFEALAGQRYWFSAQAGDHGVPPQWGRLETFDVVTGCSSALRSEYFSFPDWVPSEAAFGYLFDASQEFDCAGPVDILHTHVDPTEVEGEAWVIDAEIIGHRHELDPDRIWMSYRIGRPGIWVRVDMEPVGQRHWQATIPAQTQPTEIAYYIHAQDIEGNAATAPRDGQETPFCFEVAWLVEDFEGDTGGWTVDPEGDDDAWAGVWGHVDPIGSTAQPENDHTSVGTLCWVTGNDRPDCWPDHANVNGGCTTLQSAVYDLNGAVNAKAKYWRWYSNDRGENPGSDHWVVDVRNNQGPWLPVEDTVASSNAWEQAEVDLSAVYGENLGEIELRFVASDEDPGSLVEAAVDDFVILADFTSSEVVGGIDRRAPSIRIRNPNPFRPSAEIRIDVPRATAATLSVHDVSGRLVRALLHGQTVPAGETILVWDGTSDEGDQIESGVYFLRLTAGVFEATRPLVLLK